MDRIALLPPAFLRARLDRIQSKLDNMPTLKLGIHGDRNVIREYYYVDGIRHQREYLLSRRNGKAKMEQLRIRGELIREQQSIDSLLVPLAEQSVIDTSKVKTPFGKEFWESLGSEMNDMRIETDYVHKGIRMRSRGEIVIAQVLDSLGLEYKYEPRIRIDGDMYFPDFVVYIPEFERCFFIEFLGMIDDKEYSLKNGMKLGIYMNAGIVPNRDLLMFCGTRNSMVSVEEITADLIALIRKYCDQYILSADQLLNST